MECGRIQNELKALKVTDEEIKALIALHAVETENIEAKLKQHFCEFQIELSKKTVDLEAVLRPLPGQIAECIRKVEGYGDLINEECQKNLRGIIDALKVDTLRV